VSGTGVKIMDTFEAVKLNAMLLGAEPIKGVPGYSQYVPINLRIPGNEDHNELHIKSTFLYGKPAVSISIKHGFENTIRSHLNRRFNNSEDAIRYMNKLVRPK
jgi:hypothetical protein